MMENGPSSEQIAEQESTAVDAEKVKLEISEEEKENKCDNTEDETLIESKNESKTESKEQSVEEKEDVEEKPKKKPSSVPIISYQMLPTWTGMAQNELEGKEPPKVVPKYPPNKEINDRISFYKRGNSAILKVDGIVNAANAHLAPGGGICGVLHAGSGPKMAEECRQIGYTETGTCAVTKGYNLPAKYCIHAVGPIGEQPEMLKAVYQSVLDKIDGVEIRSVGFCCISTGIYGYPSAHAAPIALKTVRKWLECEENRAKCDRIVFVLFERKDIVIYDELKHVFFPIPDVDYNSQSETKNEQKEIDFSETKKMLKKIEMENKERRRIEMEKRAQKESEEKKDEVEDEDDGEVDIEKVEDEEKYMKKMIKKIKNVKKAERKLAVQKCKRPKIAPKVPKAEAEQK